MRSVALQFVALEANTVVTLPLSFAKYFGTVERQIILHNTPTDGKIN